MATKAKTIKMLLYDGTLTGVTNISDSAWAIGNMYSAPRESINALITKADCKVHIGSLVCIGTSEYFIWDIKHDEDLKVTYYCRKITEKPEPGDLWLHERKYLSAAITEMDSLKGRTIKQIPPDILKQVLERRFSSETGKTK